MSSRSDPVPDTNTSNVPDVVKRKVDELLTKMSSDGKLDVESEEYKKLIRDHGAKVALEIRHLYYKKLSAIDTKAKELAEKIYNKAGKTKTASEMIKKINNLKSKEGWGEEQKNRVIHHLTKLYSKDNVHGRQPELMPGSERSVIFRSLGYEHIKHDNGLSYPAEDGSHLNTILRIREETESTSELDYINSLSYSDLSLTTLLGPTPKNLIATYIHPVIALFFAIKLEIMENHVVRSDLGRIVHRRHLKKEVDPRDLVLFESITFDPNDATCNDISVMQDLSNRYQFQRDLKECIRNLRSGVYFPDTSNQIFTSLRKCRNNFFDSADIIYESDESNFIKKLMGIFSIRPILVKTEPFISEMYNVFFPAFNRAPDSYPTPTLISVPMITLTLPGVITDFDKAKAELNAKKLTDAITQNIWVKEGNNYMPRVQNLIAANEMILIMVKRNADSYKYSPANPYNYFSGMYPSLITNTQVVNKYPVEFISEMYIPDDSKPYQLRSILALKESQFKYVNSKREIEVETKKSGQVALFQSKDDSLMMTQYGTCFAYDPQSVGTIYADPTQQTVNNNPTYYRNTAFTEIAKHFSTTDDENTMAFQTRGRLYGVAFVYAKNMFN